MTINMEKHVLDNQIKSLPKNPGVYIFKDKNGVVLYIGKAVNLKARVNSYLKPDPLRPQIDLMMNQAVKVDYVLVNSDLEALIAETNLIKKFKPKYNIRMRDDKNYLFIKITKEDFARIILSRKVLNDKATYFGPYTNSLDVRNTLNLLQKLYPFRTCKESPLKKRLKPCLMYHIKRCSGPCIDQIVKEDYKQVILKVKSFLEGKGVGALVGEFKAEMKKAAENQDFERASLYRDRYFAIEKMLEKQFVVSTKIIDLDVLGYAKENNLVGIAILKIRDGKLAGKEHFNMEIPSAGENDEDILSAFISQYYEDTSFYPKEILLPFSLQKGKELIEELLFKLSKKKINIKEPKIGRQKEIIKLANLNAKEYLSKELETFTYKSAKAEKSLKELSSILGVENIFRIECFDISNIQGTSAVGSMVVFEGGEPKKDEYRKFKIKKAQTPNDYLMMEEVLRRRLMALTLGHEKFIKTPDLILVDGGKGQLSVLKKVADELNLNINMVGLAKKHEDLYIYDLEDNFLKVTLPKNSQAMFLLQNIRDEAHRFAVSYHRLVRSKKVVRSVLDEIPGIGPKTKKALLDHFGSLDNIRKANSEDMEKIIGKDKAKILMENL
ncbi:excinuclease ABC subunit C [bacterium (Candidatus Howlettbacteria) CG_4_10_14_3_um_filter_37_10]|nr:MAG: excinuclease ABC subunit C [bacterium (Candidatus Howlettbacteria) CG_4_10_14_3_um_filter_37_10]PJB06107.1 MAG: excinuclease ABC subunit C [bacterium (Candidatus Howlettbacteria) CG_4_9_14_3_um_filter_37_10]